MSDRVAGPLILILGLIILIFLVNVAFRRQPCRHERVRCIHGDEINQYHGRRVLCLDCGEALLTPMPRICWYTGKPHLRAVNDGDQYI